jgi:SpoVK/Ycf46/Vps4 family AAA+-type ATPase
LRATADRPRPDDVACVLLLARAVSNCGRPLHEILSLLREPRPIVTLVSPVEGVNERLRMMISAGLVLKGEHEVKDAQEVHLGRASWRSSWKPNRLIAFTAPQLSGEISKPPAMRDQIASVMSANEPILILGEEARAVPIRLAEASQLLLDTGPLDSSTIAQTIDICIGSRPTETIDAAQCARLDLTDLLIAIRPGATADSAIQALRRYADEDNDDEETGDRQSSSPRSNKTSSRSRTADIDVVVLQPDRSPGAHTIDTAAGYGKAIDWADDLRLDLAAWKAGEIVWSDLSAKILLAGPPGTGKTMFARTLGNSMGVPVILSSPAHWLEPSYLGDVLTRMKAVFAEARRLAPSVLFIDEVDGLGSRANGGDRDYSSYHRNVVDQALILLDGLAATQGVIVVAATNRPEDLDPALVRSGRLETRIDIHLPDEAALVEIIRHHVGKSLFDSDPTAHGLAGGSGASSQAVGRQWPPQPAFGGGNANDSGVAAHVASDTTPIGRDNLLSRLARSAIGLSGADIERLVRTARRRARREKRALQAEDLVPVFSERHKRLSPEMRWRMAVHEAGHVIVHRELGYGEPLSVHLDDTGGRMVPNLANRVLTENELMNQIILLLAGRAAEEVVFGDVSAGAAMSEASDIALATDLALRIEAQFGFVSLLYFDEVALRQRLLMDDELRRRVRRRLQTGYGEAVATIRGAQRDFEALARSLAIVVW